MKTCLGCGRLNPATATACAKCGAPLPAADGQPAAAGHGHGPASARAAAPAKPAAPAVRAPIATPPRPAPVPPPAPAPVAAAPAPVAAAALDHIELVPMAETVEVIEMSAPAVPVRPADMPRPVLRRPVPQDETAPAPLDPEVLAMEAARDAGPGQLLRRLTALSSGKGKVAIAAAFGALAVAGVIAAVALPAYQDRGYQSKVNEIMGEARGLAAKATDEYARTSAFPTRLALPSIVRRELEAMRIDPQTGVIEVKLVFPTRQGSIFLVPEVSNGRVDWVCQATPEVLKLAGKGCTAQP